MQVGRKAILAIALVTMAMGCGKRDLPQKDLRPYNGDRDNTPTDTDVTPGDSDDGDSGLETGLCPDYIGADDGCDCGCGVIDPDCLAIDSTGCAEEGCYVTGCGYCYDSSLGGVSTCTPIISGWECSTFYYGDNSCDCGCGITDVDCEGLESCAESGCRAAGCQFCFDNGDTVACADETELPEGWTCSASWYKAGDGCDCGCGALDGDCPPDVGCSTPGCNVGGCQYCSDGTGSTAPCPPLTPQ